MNNSLNVAYFRVSTRDQSVAMQRAELAAGGITFDREFVDEGVSGVTIAANRPGFAEMLKVLRSGDTLHVYAVDRLGRDAIDVLASVRLLMERGVMVNVRGLGVLTGGAGQLVLGVLAQVAELERARIRERTAAGRELARKSLAETGKTHRGKTSLGRAVAADAVKVVTWRKENKASIMATARNFGVSTTTVKRYAVALKRAAGQGAAAQRHHEGAAA